MADGYLIGQNLREKLRVTIDRVDEMPYGRRPTPIPTRFEALEYSSQQKVFRICTFTGAWNIDTTKTVKFKGVTATPNTVAAQNLFANISGSTSTSVNTPCAIAKDGTAWYLIAARCP